MIQAAMAAVRNEGGSKLKYVFNLGTAYFTESELRAVFDLFDHTRLVSRAAAPSSLLAATA